MPPTGPPVARRSRGCDVDYRPGDPCLAALRNRLAALPNDALGALLRGVEKESLRVTPDGRLATTPHPRGAGRRADAPAHHDRLQRGAARVDHGRPPQCRGVRARARRNPSVRLPASRRRNDVVEQHAVPAAGRRRHTPRTIRQVERRQAEDRLPDGTVTTLRPPDADDIGRPLQLLVARGGARVAAGRRRPGTTQAKPAPPATLR